MRVKVTGWAWLPKDELTPLQIVRLKERLLVIPRRTSQEQKEDPEPIPLFYDNGTHLGIPREYFFSHRRPIHEVELCVSHGSRDWWPAEFVGTLRSEQQLALEDVTAQFRSGRYGGIIQAKPGWGKTVCALSIAAELRVPTLVVVHKEFLMDQWKERIEKFLPAAKVGHIQQDVCDFKGCTIVMGMIHSLARRRYPEELYDWPGLIVGDEIHRTGARTWAPVFPKFTARYRLGFTATPRRKDLADEVFWQHIGPVIFAGKEERLRSKVKRVWSKFKLVKTDRFNPNLAPRSLLLRFLCASRHRNDMIVNQIVSALNVGRKCLVLSERLNHLDRLETRLKKVWGGVIDTGWYVGGKSREQLAKSAKAQVIFATVQFASEGLDIPALDTLFLTTPMSDVEQAVGRIVRFHEGKKDPIVVDIRDDAVSMFALQGLKRDEQYKRIA